MNDPLIDRIAHSVLDGDAVDWAAAESTGGPALGRVRHLKIVAALAQAHRLEHWGHLKILGEIGRGSFGTVYRAWDTTLDREVALKLVPAEPRSSNELASSLIREGRLLARVQHPNVVIIHGADRLDGYVGLWMELVQGQSLEGAIRGGVDVLPARRDAHRPCGQSRARGGSCRGSAAPRRQGAERHAGRRRPDRPDGLRNRPRPRRHGLRSHRHTTLPGARGIPGEALRRHRAISTAWACCSIAC